MLRLAASLAVIGAGFSVLGGRFPEEVSAWEQDVFAGLPSASYCVRTLTSTGVAGCSTTRHGVQGALVLVHTANDLNVLLGEDEGEIKKLLGNEKKVVLALDDTFLNDKSVTSTFLHPRNEKPDKKVLDYVTAIAFLTPEDTNAVSSEAEVQKDQLTVRFSCANRRIDRFSQFDFNSAGTDLCSTDFGVPIVFFDRLESRLVRRRALANLVGETPGVREISGRHFLQLNLEMSAKLQSRDTSFSERRDNDANEVNTSSKKCLDNASCLPRGGYSVWATYGTKIRRAETPMLNETQVFVMTHMDSLSLTQFDTVGADGAVSGLVTLLAVANAMRPHVDALGDEASGPQPVYLVFDGETTDSLGSRMLRADVESFSCTTILKNAPFGCLEPYVPYPEFQAFSFANTRLNSTIEIAQVGLSRHMARARWNSHLDPKQIENEKAEIFVHSKNTNSSLIPLFLEATANVSLESASIDPALVNASLPAPSSTQGLLQSVNLETRDHVVIADHATHFRNQAYGSRFDKAIDTQLVCKTATAVAKALSVRSGLFTSIGDSTVEADCALVQQLVHCLLEDFACDLMRQYLHQDTLNKYDGKTASTHPGVFVIGKDANALTNFVHAFLAEQVAPSTWRTSAECSLNAHCIFDSPTRREMRRQLGDLVKDVPTTDFQCAKRRCVRALSRTHRAREPSLEFDYAKRKWRTDKVEDDALLAAESHWPTTVGVSLTVRERYTVEVIVLVAGLVVFAAALGSACWLRREFDSPEKLD